MAYGMYVKFTTQAGTRDELVRLLVDAADSMNHVEGCQVYIVNVSETEPDTIWVTEVWRDAAAHADSLKLEATQSLIQQARPYIAGIEQIPLVPVGGKGL
ncbi:putative quinol monooxygenase [Tumebacillus flagellatus]|uniref:Antibiotic biosynthesis monooxygenase n=1 Tax=Tumebacillus flagellatus TaxID=1157490 RepID=A0A074LUV4_9BACL|nr:antibiotic biosynthesis monooxygenase [Tumebacillus flagellatus]